MGDAGVTLLADALRVNRTLRAIDVTGTPMLATAPMLPCVSASHRLAENGVKREGALAFASMLEVNRSLLQLILGCTSAYVWLCGWRLGVPLTLVQ